jgi:predicted enzyme related to lactoylglutathione lyase
MAQIQDPGGAPLCLWQSITHYGAGVFGKPGSLCWTELSTHDPKRALAFYGALFGWEGESKPAGEFTYAELFLDGMPLGGILGLGEGFGSMPDRWTPYFAVARCDAAAEAAEHGGGSVLHPPTDMPGIGRFAALRDPQGASFSVIELAER